MGAEHQVSDMLDARLTCY